MATPDYSKIWGANSPLAKYEFTEADYLRGWEFIGSMPPARTMFDAWMRKADEKMRWLYDNAFSENSLGGFLFWRLPDTAYFVGEKRALQDGPLDVYLECTIAGRTSKEQMKKLPQGAEIGKTFVDGTATWLVRQFATSAALDDHRKKTPLDHPDGSVLKKHLGFEVYDKDEVYNKNEINQSYRKIGNRIVSGDADWNTLTEATTYKIDRAVMDAAHHAPPNEYNFGLLVVNRLENGADGEWRTVQIYFPHQARGYWSRMYNGPADYRAGNWLEWRYIPTHNEVETIAERKANTKVSKSGDTMTGELSFSVNKGSVVGKVANENSYWRVWGSDNRPSVALDIYGNGDNAEKSVIYSRKFVNDNMVAGITLIGEDNNAYFPYAVNANTFYANDWFRAKNEGGLYFEKYVGGWYMSDSYWVRSFQGKSIYTSGTMKADGGFEGYLRGTADNANGLQGKDVNHFYRHLGGRETPTLVPLVDWERMKQENDGRDVRNINNPAAGIVAYGGDALFGQKYSKGTILLKQSYRNFDKILVCCSNDDGDYSYNALWDKWEMEFMFANAYRFDIAISNHCYWQIFGNKRGSSNAPLSTETLWRGSGQDCGLIEIYGVYY